MENNAAQKPEVRLLALAGSMRKASLNRKLLAVAVKTAQAGGAEVDVADLRELALPLYDGDLEEAEGPPEAAVRFKARIAAADGLLIASPEYNHSFPGVLKNAIDWASRDRSEGSLMGKPATIIGAGGRAGTARAQMQLHETLAETGALVMVKPGLQIQAFSPQQFDANGNLIDENTKELLAKHVEALVTWTRLISRPMEYVRYACEMDTATAVT